MKHTIVIMCCCFIFGISCRTEVPYDFPDFETVPVLNAVFEAGEPMWAHVSFTNKMENNPLSFCSEALVVLWSNGVVVDTLRYEDEGRYLTDSLATIGKTYELKVFVPGHDTIRATQTIPQPARILHTEHIPLVSRNEEGHMSAFRITVSTTPGELRYLRFFADGVIGGYAARHYSRIYLTGSKDDPSYIAEGIPFNVVSNALFLEDSTCTFQLDFQQGRYYNVYYYYRIYCVTVSEDYYEYERSSYIYNESRYPEFSFGGVPPYNLYSNTSNGYGIVMASAREKTDTIRITNNMSSFASF